MEKEKCSCQFFIGICDIVAAELQKKDEVYCTRCHTSYAIVVAKEKFYPRFFKQSPGGRSQEGEDARN